MPIVVRNIMMVMWPSNKQYNVSPNSSTALNRVLYIVKPEGPEHQSKPDVVLSRQCN